MEVIWTSENIYKHLSYCYHSW